MQINEDNMMKYEFQITFGLGFDQIKLKFTISLQIHKTYYMCSNGNCLVSTKIHVQSQNISRILYPLLRRVFGYADTGKHTAKMNVSPDLGKKKILSPT